jgi:hypothetical protein
MCFLESLKLKWLNRFFARMHGGTGAVLLCCFPWQTIDSKPVIFGGTVGQREKRIQTFTFLRDLWLNLRGMSAFHGLMGLRKGARGTRDCGQGLEETPHNLGYGGIAAGGPDSGVAVGVVADFYGDVAHGFAPRNWRFFVSSLYPECSQRG